MTHPDRRAFLAAGAAIAMNLPSAADAAGGGPPPAATTPAAALQLLRAGNQRFLSDKSTCHPQTSRRLELAAGQNPFAVILSCSDSRVPVETVFDQDPGHLFSVRIAGNFLDGNGLGSIEYGVAVLKAPLVLVLGHTHCGAVTAAVDFVKSGALPPGSIANLVHALEGVARATEHDGDNWVENAIVANVRETVNALHVRSTIVADAAMAGRVEVKGGIYDLHTGRVNFTE